MDKQVALTQWILTTFILKGVLAANWSVNVPIKPICAVVGSTVVLPCSYDYPEDSFSQPSVSPEQDTSRKEGHTNRVLSEMWCLESSRCITQSYVFHSAGVFLDPAYDNRVRYLGRPGTKNCSLQISGVRESDGGAYVFYLVTSHPTQKMPPQTGVHLLVAASPDEVAASARPCGAVRKGRPLQLACCGAAAAAPGDQQYHWLVDRGAGAEAVEGSPGQVWTVGEAQADDSGTYTCQVRSAEGLVRSADVTVDVQYPPHNTSVTVLPAGSPEKGVVFNCSSDASPPVHSYTWYQSAACPTAAGGRPEVPAAPVGRGQTLHADTPTGESELYCCVARNALGSHHYTVTLYVDADGETQVSSKRQRWLIVGTTTVTILVIVGIVAFALRWKLEPSPVSQSYTLTGTSTPKS